MSDVVVARLYRALVDELERRGHAEDTPITVSEIFEDLVPYAAVRSTLDIGLNADYEHALLRLLAGEADLLHVEPATAREELRREIEAPYPSVGLFRRHGGAEVWVAMDGRHPAEGSPTPDGHRPDPDDEPGPDPHDEPPRNAPGARAIAEASPARRSGGPPIRLHREREGAPARDGEAEASCVECGEPLPRGPRIRFCPRCGTDQRLRPCPECGEMLEDGWRYCTGCGAEVGAG